MHVHPDAVGRAAVQALIAQQRPALDEFLVGGGREVIHDVGLHAVLARHVRVVRPDLAVGLQRIAGVADDDGAAPFGQARQVAVVGGIDRDCADRAIAEDIDARVRGERRVRRRRIAVQEADEASEGSRNGAFGHGSLRRLIRVGRTSGARNHARNVSAVGEPTPSRLRRATMANEITISRSGTLYRARRRGMAS